jgi:hypothetical protein
MKKFLIAFLLISLYQTSTLAFERAFEVAFDDNAAYEDSINKTQELLRDSAQRKKAVMETSDAQKADFQVQHLAPDSKTQNAYYDLAADIMGNYKSTHDENGMKQSVQDGLRNPAEFFENLTPEQKKKIEELAGKVNPGTQPKP